MVTEFKGTKWRIYLDELDKKKNSHYVTHVEYPSFMISIGKICLNVRHVYHFRYKGHKDVHLETDLHSVRFIAASFARS